MSKHKIKVLIFSVLAFVLSIITTGSSVNVLAEGDYEPYDIIPFEKELDYYSQSTYYEPFLSFGFPDTWKVDESTGKLRIYPDKKLETEYIRISVLPIAEYANQTREKNAEEAIKHFVSDAPRIMHYIISDVSTERYLLNNTPIAKVSFYSSETSDPEVEAVYHHYYILPNDNYNCILVDVIRTDKPTQRYKKAEEAFLLTFACENDYLYKDYLGDFPDAKMPTFKLPESVTKSRASIPTPTPTPTPPPTPVASSSQKTVTYVLNANTKKFHLPNCSSVSQMNKSNRIDSTLSRDEIIKKGYVPCKRCHP